MLFFNIGTLGDHMKQFYELIDLFRQLQPIHLMTLVSLAAIAVAGFSLFIVR
jgi:hypothetical protein